MILSAFSRVRTGAAFSATRPRNELLTPLLERKDSRYQAQISFRGWEPELPAGLREGQRLTEALDALTTSRMLRAGYDFDGLPIQFRAVSTNLVDGRAYVFSRGSMTEALRASMAIPLLFTPLEKDGMLLVDGGLANNLPNRHCSRSGSHHYYCSRCHVPSTDKGYDSDFVDVVDQSISLQMERNVRENRKLASLVLQPQLEKLTNSDYDKIPEIVARGEEEARRNLDQLKALAGTWRLLPHLKHRRRNLDSDHPVDSHSGSLCT